MSITRSIFRGLGLALTSPAILLGLWLVNVAVALPAAVALRAELEDAVGASLFHRSLEEGFDTDWYAEYHAGATGLAKTFTPSVIGAAAIFDNLENWWKGGLFGLWPGLVALGVAYALVWAFLLGGVLEKLHQPERLFATEAFLSACGRHFASFLGLVAMAALPYYLVYRFARWLFPAIEGAMADVTSERTILWAVLAGAAVIVLLLSLVRLVFDYAKVAVILEKRGAISALGRGVVFVLGHPIKTFGVYAGMGTIWLGVIALYAVLAPGTGQSTLFAVILAFAFSQLYLIARLYVRLALLGAEMTLLESRGRSRRFRMAV